jgi:hypothetical protein
MIYSSGNNCLFITSSSISRFVSTCIGSSTTDSIGDEDRLEFVKTIEDESKLLSEF